MKKVVAAYSVLAVILVVVCAISVWFMRDFHSSVPFEAQATEVTVTIEGDDVVSASLVPLPDGKYVELNITSLDKGPGKCVVSINNVFEDDPSGNYSRLFDCEVLSSGLLMVQGGIVGAEPILACTVIFLAALAIGLGWRFVYRKRNGLLCTYSTVASLAYSIFTGASTFVLGAELLTFVFLKETYDLTALVASVEILAVLFVVITIPFVLLSSLFLTISNISLIRHEGMRPANMLGIAVAILSAACYLVMLLGVANDNGQNPVLLMFDIAFPYLVNLLGVISIATIVCGILAARNKPAFDKDYVIILGCGIRKDGTPTPILEGRIRRAMKFVQEQLDATGKQAKFVCSGGQGADEIVSEAECMANYLKEHGIDDSLILLEDRSVSTFQNMKFSRVVIENDQSESGTTPKTAYSTTNYHVFRSGTFALDVGLDAEGMGAKTKWYFWPNAFLREFASFLVCSKASLIPAVLGIILFAAAMGAAQSLL